MCHCGALPFEIAAASNAMPTPQSQLESMQRLLDEQATRITALLNEREQLGEALDKWGAHQIQCACHFTREPCDCGLDDVRAALAASEPSTPAKT
jgi:hypothetical protein